MTAVNSEEMGLTPDKLNAMDRWLLDFLNEHEWATPNLMRHLYNDEHEDDVSRQWISSRITRLSEHGHLEHVHDNASEYQLVDDPR